MLTLRQVLVSSSAQCPQPFQLGQLLDLCLLPAEGEAEIHDKLAALARLALNGDGAAHQVHDILGDGKAQTRALNAADGGAFLTGELLKDVLLELLIDADAVVLDAELIIAAALGRAGLLSNADAHHAAGGGELDSIGKDVQQHLIQPQRVGDDILVLHIHGINKKRQPFGTDVGLDDGALSCTRSGRCTAFSSIFTLPLSMRLMSSTSLMRESRCWLEVEIFFR